MEKIRPHTLSGFMELLPGPQTQLEAMMEILRRTYSLYGFTPLDTPAIEAADVLLAKGGGETEKQIYRFQKGDSDLALRFDLTVPLAKYVALHYGELSFPFRRYQIGKVYRGERAQRGRFREFYQADIDIIGDGKLSITNEAEIPSIIYRTFSTLGLRRFQIRVNNRKILNGFYAMLGLSEKAGDIMRTVDKLDKIGPDKVCTLLVDECGVEADKADEILRFIAIRGTNDEVLAALEQYRGKDGTFDLGLDELSAVTKLLGAFGVPEENFAVDLTIARGLDYYTGTVYETTLLDHPEIGSVCSGGRYDNLAEYYTDRPLPGVGISIGLTRLFYVLNEQGMLNDARVMAPADVMIVPMTDDLEPSVRLATGLRERSIRVQLYAEQKKFKAKIQYADKLHIPYVIFLGEDEVAAGTVSLKDLRSGEQITVPAADAAERILADARAVAESTFRELDAMRSAQNEENDHQRINAARAEMRRKLNETQDSLRKDEPAPEEKKSARAVQVGDVVQILPLAEDLELALLTNEPRALLVHTALLAPKTTRGTQGVQVMNIKPKYRLERLADVADTGITNQARYRTRTIPAAGALLRPEDSEEKQLELL